MRIDVLRFNGQLEVPGMASSSRYRITSGEGFSMTVTPFGVLARHDRRELDVLIPWNRIDSADVLPQQVGVDYPVAAAETAVPDNTPLLEPASDVTAPVKRGPGRPRKQVA